VSNLADECANSYGSTHSEGTQGLDKVVCECLPPVMRLLTEDDDNITFGTVHDVKLILWPSDTPDALGVELDHRAADLKVEVVIGIDNRNQLRFRLLEERGNRLARGLTSVSPTLESQQRDRVRQNRSIEPLQ
jgi:hypothetical protein